MKLILILSLAVGARAAGCRSGIGKCNDPCTTSQTVCEEDWSATWDLDCPDPSPGECSPLAPKSCTTNLDCDEGEICEGGSGRRKLRFGNIHDGCCRIADEL